MNGERPTRRLIWATAVLVMVTVAWVVWPVYSHWNWRAGAPALHAIPALCLGSLALVLLGGAARCILGCRTLGVRWLISHEAGRTALLCLGGVVTIMTLFYNIELWRGRRAYARVTEQAAKLHEPLDLQALRPPPIPAEDNFALAQSFAPLLTLRDGAENPAKTPEPDDLGPLNELLHRARRFVLDAKQPSPWMHGQFRNLDGNGRPTTSGNETATKTLAELAPLDAILADIQRTSQRPECQFPWTSVNPLFSDRVATTDKVFLGLLLVLEERALAHLRTGHSGPAYEDIQTGLRVASHLQRRPALFYTRPRAQAVARLLQPLWEGLANGRFSSAQLTTLQEQLESMDLLGDLPKRLRFQFLTQTDLIESIIPTGKTATAGVPQIEDEAALRWIRMFYPRGWSLQDQAAFHAFHFDLLTTLANHNGRPTEPEGELVRQLIRRSSDPFFAVFLIPKAVQMTYDNYEFPLFEQTVLNLARTALALERYQLAEGRYPDELEGLVPHYLLTVPEDPVNGEPLRYRSEPPNAFVLYSVGMDTQDDNGTPQPIAPRTGPTRHTTGWDWVWKHGDLRPAE